jgi:hypothetical protein
MSNWKTRRERRLRKRLVEKSNPEKIIQSLEKSVEREKPKTFLDFVRRLFTKTHSEKTLQYAKEVLKK